MVENLPAMQETQETRVQSLAQEDPLEDRMASWSSILAGKVLWTEELEGLHKVAKSDTTEATEQEQDIL